MTSFARPIICKCPQCAALVQQRRLASFNDFGAVGWTDGYSSIWGLSAVSALGRCPACKTVFWYEDLEKMGILPREPEKMGWFTRMMHQLTGDERGALESESIWTNTSDEWKSAPNAEIPSFQDWISVLSVRSSLTPERELLARRKIWWEGNSANRSNTESAVWLGQPDFTAQDSRNNLEALLQLLAEVSEQDLIEQAEILRALGRFDESIAMIERVDVAAYEADDRRYKRAERILAYARNNDPIVHEVWRCDDFFLDTENAQQAFMANPPPCAGIVEFTITNVENGLPNSKYWFNASDVQSCAESMVISNPRMIGLRGAARWASCRDESIPLPSPVPTMLMTFNNIAYELIKLGKGHVNCPTCSQTYSAGDLISGTRRNGGYCFDIFLCPAQHELIRLLYMHLMLKRTEDDRHFQN